MVQAKLLFLFLILGNFLVSIHSRFVPPGTLPLGFNPSGPILTIKPQPMATVKIIPKTQQVIHPTIAPQRPPVNQRELIPRIPKIKPVIYPTAIPERPPVDQRELTPKIQPVIYPTAIPERPPVVQRALITREKPELITYLKGKAKSDALVCLLEVLNKLDNKENIFIPEDNSIDDLISEGISETLDLTSMLLQFNHLAIKDQQDIISCDLNMNAAMERCNEVYDKPCELIEWNFLNPKLEQEKIERRNWLKSIPYVTRKCPSNYVRIGCCKCMPVCPENLFTTTLANQDDKYDYCIKKRTYETPIIKAEIGDPKYESGYEILRPGIYVQECDKNFQRIGQTMCNPKCPFGWPDLGDRCQKKNRLVLMPFVWQVGDGKSN